MKHDNNMKDYSWWLTDHHNLNHSNYLVCDRANTQSVTVRKSGKTATQLINALVIKWNLQYRPVRREERGCSFFITFTDVYAFSDVSLRRQVDPG